MQANSHPFRALMLLLFVAVSLPTASAQEDSVDRDYTKELPRLNPTSPSMAARTFTLPPGFELRTIASEPLIVDPVAIAFDEWGRLYAVEMRGYSEQGDEDLGRIQLLEDKDRDGYYETSRIFASGLSWPTAITCYDGGVFVGAPPHIYYLKDTDGDGVADQKRIEFTGFGRGNVQGLLNSFRWGLDNRIHGATSSSGATVTRPEKEGNPLTLRGRDFAIDPRTRTLTAESGGAQHGLSFNRWGEKFVCSNSNHIQYVLYDDHYAARNPYVKAPSARASIAADGPQADVFRASPVEPWRIVRTRLRVKGIVRGPVEGGGTPAGYFTGATGVTIYRGDAWPKQYVDWAFVGDVGSNLVHRKKLTRKGLSYVANRVDRKKEFLTSTDIWFRPVQFANGPNGGLYIVDMYREVIEHPLSLPPVIKRHLDLTSGRDRGRIHVIVPSGFQNPYAKEKRLGEMSASELVQQLESPNGWRRDTAARLLYERQDASVAAGLEKLANESSRAESRLLALHALNGLEALRPAAILAALKDDNDQVRRHAVKLAEPLTATSSELRTALCAMTDDPSLLVRCQLAFSLGAFQSDERDGALAKLLMRDASNSYVRFAAATSSNQGAGAILARLLADAAFAKSSAGKLAVAGIAAQIAKQRRGDDVAKLLRLLPQLAKDRSETLQLVVTSMGLKDTDPLSKQIAAATGGQANAIMKQLISASMTEAADAKLPVAKRVAAVQSLELGTFGQSKALLSELLTPAQPAPLQQAALRTAGAFSDEEVGPWIVARWATFSPALRTAAGDILLSRETWTPHLLSAVESKRIAAGDLEAGRLRILASSPNKALAKRAAKLIEAGGNRARTEIVQRYRSALTLEGDAVRGKTVFKNECASCHQLAGVGHPIGPNLAAMRNRGDEAVLLNVLAPNQEVNPQYLNYVVQTVDGRSLSGMIASESANSILLKRADNKTDQVLRIDIENMRSTGMSLMPEGLEKKIRPQDMADLLAFLRSLD